MSPRKEWIRKKSRKRRAGAESPTRLGDMTNTSQKKACCKPIWDQVTIDNEEDIKFDITRKVTTVSSARKKKKHSTVTIASAVIDSNHGNHGNLLEVCNVNKSVSIESDTVFSHDDVLTFSRGMFDLMYRTVYPEISLSGLEGHVFIVHGNHGNHGNHSVYTRVSRVGSYDFITSVLSININRNIASLEDGVNGLCIVNNLYGESVNENVVRSVLGCVEGYSFGYVMFYNVLSGNLGGEPSVECFDLKGRAMVFDLSNANERTLFEQ